MPWENQPDDLPTRAELARDLLLYVMKDYADEVCASWLVNQEFYLWEAAHLGRFPTQRMRPGHVSVSASDWLIWPRWQRVGGCVQTLSGVKGTRKFFSRKKRFVLSTWLGGKLNARSGDGYFKISFFPTTASL